MFLKKNKMRDTENRNTFNDKIRKMSEIKKTKIRKKKLTK